MATTTSAAQSVTATGTADNTSVPSSAIAAPVAVDPRRKNTLLLEARANRSRWIQSVPLPLSMTDTAATGVVGSDTVLFVNE